MFREAFGKKYFSEYQLSFEGYNIILTKRNTKRIVSQLRILTSSRMVVPLIDHEDLFHGKSSVILTKKQADNLCTVFSELTLKKSLYSYELTHRSDYV